VKNLTVDWEGLRTFAVFVEQGSFSAAARGLGLTHATVSRRLRLLEQHFGGSLYERRGEDFELTTLGQAVLDAARDMAERSSALERRLAGTDFHIEGTVRIATTEAMGALFLAPRLSSLLLQWPGLNIEITTNHQSVSLARRDADIAIRFARPEAVDLVAKRLGTIPYFLCGTPDCVAAMARDGGQPPFITFDDGVPDIPETIWCARNIEPDRIRVRSNSLVAQWQAACAGSGLALLPGYLIDSRLQRASEVPVLHREVWMVFHRDFRNVPRLRKAVAWLETCFADPS
jgi:DNA-binding transcriptional LysR family regulator